MSLTAAWYGARWRLCWLWPLQCLMRVLVALRRGLYRWHVLPSGHPGIPVIVVGNIAVGGTGKTPLVLWLAQWLRQQGWQPGIVSRGYGGNAPHYPCEVHADSEALHVGDEPLLLKRKSALPVVVDPVRLRGARQLRVLGCDVVISDDGLQHYAMQRDIEIVVVDAVRQLGNGWLLPAGPLREPRSRLRAIDLRVGNGAAIPGLAEHAMLLLPQECQSLLGEQQRPLADFAGQRVHAVAGIGNPARFFAMLRAAGLQVEPHPFADHHAYSRSDLPWQDAAILMTEKDAVKCAALDLPDDVRQRCWVVPVSAEMPAEFSATLANRLQALRRDAN